jgi:hypothetical protein
MRVIENKNMCAGLTRMRVESTRMHVVRKKSKKKTQHGADACRSKVYVYYDKYKVIF